MKLIDIVLLKMGHIIVLWNFPTSIVSSHSHSLSPVFPTSRLFNGHQSHTRVRKRNCTQLHLALHCCPVIELLQLHSTGTFSGSVLRNVALQVNNNMNKRSNSRRYQCTFWMIFFFSSRFFLGTFVTIIVFNTNLRIEKNVPKFVLS